MKRSLLIMLLAVTSTMVAAQASSKSLSGPRLLPHGAGILSVNEQQNSAGLSLGDGMCMLVARAAMPAPSSHRNDAEPEKVSGRELNLSSIQRVIVTQGTKTKDVVNEDDEEKGEGKDEDEEEGEDGNDENEGEGRERMWNAPKLG